MDSALKKEIETLIAAALVPCQKRIARLEQEVKELKGTLNILAQQMPQSEGGTDSGNRMTAYALFITSCREEHKRNHPSETISFSEFSRQCAERWRNIPEEEKQRLQEMANIGDQKPYGCGGLESVSPTYDNDYSPELWQKEDEPKRALSAFFWCCNDERPKIQEANPKYGVGDIARELGRKWNEADTGTRRKYEAKAELDKARYEKELKEFKDAEDLEEEDDDGGR